VRVLEGSAEGLVIAPGGRCLPIVIPTGIVTWRVGLILGSKAVRLSVVLMAMLAAGCATQPAPEISEATHAANVAAAERAGYRIVHKGDRTWFCPTASTTGSHMAPTCITETEFQSLLGPPRSMSTAAHVTNQSPGPGAGAGH
jgi:hypothetical protein